jgi:hypothetical protein
MKKHLLIGSALLAAISAYPQSGKMVKPSGIIENTPKKVYTEASASQHQTTVINGPVKKSLKAVNGNAKVSSAITRFTGSMNVFGYLVSQSRPLQYNGSLNAVSMITRKDGTYTASSNSNSGTIVGHYSTNMGGTWNETCLFTDGTNLGRYPNGGIYNPLGNTNITSAYIIGTGPQVATAPWVGNYYANKPITVPGTTTPGTDVQKMLNASLPATMRKHHFSRYAFTAIDGGLVRSMANVLNDPDGTTYAAIAYRGAAMVKGTFNAGSFVWGIDSFIPATTMNSGGYKNLNGVPLQAWDESGVVGYVVMLGSRADGTLSATRVGPTGGFQPIVYKTTNSGASWSLLPGNDFADMACFTAVNDRTYPVQGLATSTLIVANFQNSEGWDAVVDANGQLHIGSMIVGHTSNHVDSLGYRSVFGTEQYNYAETGPFNYPVFYDFYTYAAGGWGYHMIDSMGTEGPSGTSGQPGYSSNQWSDGSGAKMDQDARFQMSRSIDGTKIFYTWTESDTNITGVKWNMFPDLKVKGYDVVTKMMTDRLDVTNADANLTQSAYYHYTSNKAAVSAGTYTIPTTLTKNATLDGSINTDTYFNDNAVFASSSFSITAMAPKSGCTVTAISNQTAYNYEVSAYPNPANQQTTVVVRLKEKASNIEVTILNSVGQLVNTYHVNGQLGVNEVNVNLSNLSAGVYFYNVKVENASVTKKLIVQ